LENSPVFDVQVQETDFDIAQLQRSLLQDQAQEGAVATFTGYVRRDTKAGPIDTMTLEHYPGMTESSILKIAEEAAQRWPLMAAKVVHRVGPLSPGDQIVWVGVASAHRGAAFAACEFIMDYLKTQAPFWKKEAGASGGQWVDAREEDYQRADRWRE
jgi:molybdopterin synthase catalytic subunit